MPSPLSFFAYGIVLLVAAFLSRRRSSLNSGRIGIDPGIFGFRLWAAKQEFQASGHRLLDRGYHECKDENFWVQTPDMERLIVSPKFLPELRVIPEGKLSHSASLVERLLGQYNGMDELIKSRQHSDVCRVQLTQKLPYFVPDMNEELRLAMPEFLKDVNTEKSTSIPTYAFAYTMVLSVASRSFVSLPTSRDPQWLKASTDWQMTIWQVAAVLRPYPAWLRPILRPFLAPKSHLDRILKSAHDVLYPLIDERLRSEDKHLDLLQFLILTSKSIDKPALTLRLLGLMTAALHTSSMVTTQALYEMCAKMEYIADLRAEALEALRDSEFWDLARLKKLRKLDSFLKETMRLNQPDYLGFHRKVLQPIPLSNGVTLPKGLYINMAADSLARDAANYPEPNVFRPYRWYKPEPDHKPTLEEEFTGIEPGNIAWGSGRLTCPGRWYASAMIKLIIAELLIKYDIAFPEGQTKRPPNLYSPDAVRPDMEQVICLKKRV